MHANSIFMLLTVREESYVKHCLKKHNCIETQHLYSFKSILYTFIIEKEYSQKNSSHSSYISSEPNFTQL